MRKISLFFVMLFSVCLLVGCGGLKNVDYLNDKDDMKEMAAKIEKEADGNKLYGNMVFGVNHFSAKGVKVDGSMYFVTVDPKNAGQTITHRFSSPDSWSQAPDRELPVDAVLWTVDTARLEQIPDFHKDARAKLDAQKDTIGEYRTHQITVTAKDLKITYRGERKNATYTVIGDAASGELTLR
jgi:hypothetical protein